VTGNHLVSYMLVKAKVGRIRGRKLTILVLVLKTKTEPAAVPMNMCFPDGSKRATVIADLIPFNNKQERTVTDIPQLVRLLVTVILHFTKLNTRPMFFPKVG